MVKRTNSIASFVVDTSRIAHHISDGSTYLCNATHYPVKYNTDDNEWAALVTGVGDDAICAQGQSRGLYPETVSNFLLRTPTGQVYFVGTDGYRIPLFSGEDVFDCMADRYLVWDRVTDQELEHFTLHPSIVATGCFR